MSRKLLITSFIVAFFTFSIANFTIARGSSFGVVTRIVHISVLGETTTAPSFHGFTRFDLGKNFSLRFSAGVISAEGTTSFPIDMIALFTLHPLYVGGGLGFIPVYDVGIITFQGLAGLEVSLGNQLNLFSEVDFIGVSTMGINTIVPSIGIGASLIY